MWQYRGKDVTPLTNIDDNAAVTLDELWENIKREGLRDPLIMRVGVRNQKFRLEAGNHRIQVLHLHHVEMIPLTVQVQELCGPDVDDVMNNATHNFDADDLILVTDDTPRYMRPSEVFRSLQDLV